jgi:hypothetical protein
MVPLELGVDVNMAGERLLPPTLFHTSRVRLPVPPDVGVGDGVGVEVDVERLTVELSRTSRLLLLRRTFTG